MVIAAPGFFGKVPARGDFIARRMPHGFDAAWEEWLAGLVVAAREALGEAWPDDWLTAPLWHFSLGAGLGGPDGAAGILVASADRVGRLFPFTIIGAAAPVDGGTLPEWLDAAEALALDALEDGFEPDALDAALVALGPPPVVAGVARRPGQWRLAEDADPLDETAPSPPGPGQSVWWCRGSDRVAPMHLRCSGLPGPETSARMVAGGFEFDE
jgi:type VI secretion system protein ImpM